MIIWPDMCSLDVLLSALVFSKCRIQGFRESQESFCFRNETSHEIWVCSGSEIGYELFPWCYGASFQFQEGLNEIVEKRSSYPLILTS